MWEYRGRGSKALCILKGGRWVISFTSCPFYHMERASGTHYTSAEKWRQTTPMETESQSCRQKPVTSLTRLLLLTRKRNVKPKNSNYDECKGHFRIWCSIVSIDNTYKWKQLTMYTTTTAIYSQSTHQSRFSLLVFPDLCNFTTELYCFYCRGRKGRKGSSKPCPAYCKIVFVTVDLRDAGFLYRSCPVHRTFISISHKPTNQPTCNPKLLKNGEWKLTDPSRSTSHSLHEEKRAPRSI
jgi:hypothetical protein